MRLNRKLPRVEQLTYALLSVRQMRKRRDHRGQPECPAVTQRSPYSAASDSLSVSGRPGHDPGRDILGQGYSPPEPPLQVNRPRHLLVLSSARSRRGTPPPLPLTRETNSMIRTMLASAAAGILMVSVFSLNAQAFPGKPSQPSDEASVVTLVGGCGHGNHRNRAGQCVNGPAPVAGQASSGASGATCPPGTRLGTNGRNCRRID